LLWSTLILLTRKATRLFRIEFRIHSITTLRTGTQRTVQIYWRGPTVLWHHRKRNFPFDGITGFFLLTPRILQCVQRQSAIVLTVTVNGIQQIHPVDISPTDSQC
jgi:hypothetical protein